MSRFKKFGCTNFILSDCGPSDSDIFVQSGLAVTPADAMRMTEKGVPVSVTNAANFYDGVPNPSFDIPLDSQRGIDMATIWENERAIKNKMSVGHAKDVKKYGTVITSD